MPSGHSQIVGYLAGYLIYRAISREKHKNKPIKQILWEEKYLVITCIIIVLMGMIGRLNKNIGGFMSADPNGCHTNRTNNYWSAYWNCLVLYLVRYIKNF